MRDIVIVPSFYRPEYLYVCLEHILAAEGGAEKEIWIFQDRHTRDLPHMAQKLPEIERIANEFRPKFAGLKYTVRPPHDYVGNPYNFLEAYKEAHATDARFVYLVEEDVFIAKDFFRWHEALQTRADYFVTMGWHQLRNPDVKKSTDQNAIVNSTCDFSSIGVCWKREKLAEVVKHAVPQYYGTMRVYLAQNFPHCPIPPVQWTEQAGLIMRVLLQGAGTRLVGAPALSRCAHIGIFGYHRAGGYQFEGPLVKRVAELRAAAKDTAKLVSLSKDPFDDVAALPEIGAWSPETLHVAQHFDFSKANR